jgi:uncharacterized protein (DUF362 family)
MIKHKVFLSNLGGSYSDPIARGMQWTGVNAGLRSDTKICLKPNLTFPTFRQGVMTSPEAIEAIIRYLKDFTPHITICESDSGGYNRFSMDEVFQKTGLNDIAKRYDVRILNMSQTASRSIQFSHRWRQFSIPLPRILLDETDLFITMPVPKIHMNTQVSMSVKNQWGVIQVPAERLKLHPYFWRVVYEVNKALPRSISVIDGKYGLTRSGPMKGDVVDLNWLMVADNVFVADYVCCVLMRIDPRSVSYLRHIFKREGIAGMTNVDFNADYNRFVSKNAFYLKRSWTDYPGLFAFNSRPLAYIAYESPLAGLLHRLLYLFREPFYDYNQKKTPES